MTSQIVSFYCVLKDRMGHVISSSFNQNVSTGQDPSGRLRGFTRGMQGLKKGERRRIFVDAEEAYGFYELEKVIEVPRDEVPGRTSLKLGDTVMIALEEGRDPLPHRIIELSGETMMLDGNHPLAGQDLIFEIEATDVRDDDEEDEIEALAEAASANVQAARSVPVVSEESQAATQGRSKSYMIH